MQSPAFCEPRTSGEHTHRPRPKYHKVDIWRITLRQPPYRLDRARAFLSPDEIGSVDRAVEPYRTRRVLARAALRTVVSRYLDVSPANVVFTAGPHGKPQVTARHSSPVEFNLSTSGDVCLIAVTRTCVVGIDVERVAPLPDAALIAHRFFAAAEAAAIGTGDGVDVRRFLRYWTAKEAYVKGVGEGLSLPLAEIVVPREFEHEERATLRALHGASWSLIRVDPGSESVATLAVKAPLDEVEVVSEDLDPNLGPD